MRCIDTKMELAPDKEMAEFRVWCTGATDKTCQITILSARGRTRRKGNRRYIVYQEYFEKFCCKLFELQNVFVKCSPCINADIQVADFVVDVNKRTGFLFP